MTRTRRTPAEIAADLAEKAENARQRASAVEATRNPILKPLNDKLEFWTKRQNVLKRAFAEKNPNSFANRIKSFQLRIAEIEAASYLAEAQLSEANYNISALKEEIDANVASIASGESVDPVMVEVIAGNYEPDKFPDLEEKYAAARNARKGFKSSVADDDEMTATA